MKVFGIKLEKALPYLLGGAFLVLVWKIFKSLSPKSRVEGAKNIKGRSLVVRAKWGVMSEAQKYAYITEVANLIYDIWAWRLPMLDNDLDLVALIKCNSFCIKEVGEKYKTFWTAPLLTTCLHQTLDIEELADIQSEILILRRYGL